MIWRLAAQRLPLRFLFTWILILYALDITGSFSADIAMLSAGATVTSEVIGRFSHSFSGALSADKQEFGIYTELNASTTATSQNYDLVGTYTEVTWGVGSSITPTGDVNVYGHVTDITSGNVTNVDNLVGHRFTMGEGNSIGGTFGNMGFIDGRFQPGSGTTVTDFKGVYTAVDDNGDAGTIT